VQTKGPGEIAGAKSTLRHDTIPHPAAAYNETIAAALLVSETQRERGEHSAGPTLARGSLPFLRYIVEMCGGAIPSPKICCNAGRF